MKAIETRYKGYRFRSRLEARWAVFFETLGVNWEYESEGFLLSDGARYLPDFKIVSPYTKATYWYEIKPRDTASDSKFSKFKADCNAQRAAETRLWYPVLLTGDPVDAIKPSVLHGSNVCPRCALIEDPAYGATWHGNDGEYEFGCEPCDFSTPSGGDNPEQPGLITSVRPHKGSLLLDFDGAYTYQQKLWQAMKAARGARFEHGESGAA